MNTRILALEQELAERRRAEEALRESHERLSFALQKSRTGGWDLDLVDHTANRTPEHDRIFGYESLLPRWTYEMFLEHVFPDDRAEVDRLFCEAVAAQTDWTFECRIRRTDGEVRWIWAAGGHQRDDKGVARRIAGFVQDITDRKGTEAEVQRLHEELQRHAATLERRVAERTRALEEELAERQRAEEQIQSQLEELQRWQDVMLGREDRVQELKREVNDLCRRAGETARYPSEDAGSADAEAARPTS